MTRKEFIITSIYKIGRITKIILFFLITFYLIYFLKNSLFDENSNERQISILALIIFGILCILGFIKYVLNSIYLSFSEKSKTIINQTIKILEYISIPFLIYIAYMNWNENKFTILIFGLFFLISYLKKIIKKINP
jgi:uncharacterized protein YhhL (DUF1145 family)